MNAPKLREYKRTRFRLEASTNNGFDIDVRIYGNGRRGMEQLGELRVTPDQWRALNVMLAFAETKVGEALRTSVEVRADEFVSQVL